MSKYPINIFISSNISDDPKFRGMPIRAIVKLNT